ncbi:transposase [Streptomyces sp. NPDC056045]|uniref:transposase n=1 Tax=Streptomyces sp. NPDC056045 TaxID=3345691 RepID=UPI0035D8BF6A
MEGVRGWVRLLGYRETCIRVGQDAASPWYGRSRWIAVPEVQPAPADKNAYRRRNVVERCFHRLKQWRGIATRYDKHPDR